MTLGTVSTNILKFPFCASLSLYDVSKFLRQIELCKLSYGCQNIFKVSYIFRV